MENYGDLVHPYMDTMQGEATTPEGLVARVGEALPEGAKFAEMEDIVAALSTVFDPEIPVNIYELGLIYDCKMNDIGNIDIDMTLTTPNCPVAGELPTQVGEAVAGVEGVGIVSIKLTWNPPWRPDMMSEDAKLALDLF